MFELIMTSNVKRNKTVASTSDKIADVLQEANMLAGRDMWQLNGRMIDADDLDKTFSEMGIKDGSVVILSRIVKADNA